MNGAVVGLGETAKGSGGGGGGGEVTLETLRRKMSEFARERDWEQFHSPRNLLLALVRSPPLQPILDGF